MKRIVVGSEGMGSWLEPHTSGFLKVLFPGVEVVYENTEECDLIVRSHFMTRDCMVPMQRFNYPGHKSTGRYSGHIEPEWNSTPKPYIYWSGESWQVKESEYHTNYIHIDTTIEDSDAIYLPYLAKSSYFVNDVRPFCTRPRNPINENDGRRFINKNRKHLLAYCSSHPTELREDVFNKFVESAGVDNCHSFGGCHGDYEETKRRVRGQVWESKYLLRDYSEYNFVIAIENGEIPGYVTEKIMNAYSGGAIPIYWGTSEVNEFFNKDSFVNVSDFDSIDECVEYVINMETEKIHWMMDQPIFNEDSKYMDIINIHKNDDFYEKNASKLLPLLEQIT